MTPQELLNRAEELKAENPNGFTLGTDGNLITSGGFAVSVTGTDKGLSKGDVASRVIFLAGQGSQVALGYWKDEKTGEEYYDVTRITPYEMVAMDAARRYGQLAIYNLDKGEVIYL